MAALLQKLGVAGGKTLILLADADHNVLLSARNIAGVKVASTEELNLFDLVTHDALVATPSAIRRIEQILGDVAQAPSPVKETN
jgi:large subunit ribosomal protein L4